MRVFLYLTVSLFFLASCGPEQKAEKAPDSKPSYTLVFIDKTASVDVSRDFVYQKYSGAIKEAIDTHIKKAGDKLDIYFIHENTAKGRSLSLVSRTEKENTEGMNATDLEAASTNYDFSLKKEHSVFLRQALARLTQKNGSSSNAETNISASLPILNAAAAENANVFVYYLSDMVESVKAGRDFHVKPPASTQEAGQWAEQDLVRFADVNLSGVDVNFVLPFEATSSSKENNPNVTTYWQQIFESLGATVNEI